MRGGQAGRRVCTAGQGPPPLIRPSSGPHCSPLSSVYERHDAPIASFNIYADVGAYDEQDGQTGLAHLLEHMAFKGTPNIGTSDFR